MLLSVRLRARPVFPLPACRDLTATRCLSGSCPFSPAPTQVPIYTDGPVPEFPGHHAACAPITFYHFFLSQRQSWCAGGSCKT